MRDDNRGLGQGVTDNHRTALQWALVLEAASPLAEGAHPVLTQAAQAAGDRLLQPLVAMVAAGPITTTLLETLRVRLESRAANSLTDPAAV